MSGRGGPAPAATATGGATAAAGGATNAPAVTVLSQSRTSARLRIDPSPTGAPYWLVLGQSLNAGWTARIAGGRHGTLGRRQLIDGYANGWLVHPEPGQPIEVSLVWTPQRLVNGALGVSALGLLLCVALAIRSPGLALSGAAASRRALRLPERPTAWRPWRSDGSALPGRTILTVVLGSWVIAWLLIGWLAGLVVAALVALACRPGRWPLVLAGVAVAGTLASGAYVTQAEISHRYRLILEWPQHFEAVSGLAWVAVAVFFADAMLRHLRHRRGPRPR